MKHNLTLTITSLLTIVFASFHLADDVARGFEPGGTSNFNGVLILAVYLFATLMLAGRRWAHVIVLVGSIGGAGVPYLHMMGSGLTGPRVVNSGAVFFFVCSSPWARPRWFQRSSRRKDCGTSDGRAHPNSSLP